jgi:hypothetical protein
MLRDSQLCSHDDAKRKVRIRRVEDDVASRAKTPCRTVDEDISFDPLLTSQRRGGKFSLWHDRHFG